MADAGDGSGLPAGGQDPGRREQPGPGTASAELGGVRPHPPEKARRHRFSWRAPVAALLIVVGCVLAPVSVLAVWTANQVADTNTYVANVAPLITDPAIQRALTDKISNQIVTRIDVPALTSQAAANLGQRGLPKVARLVQGFSGSLASAVQGFVHGQIAKIITGPRMSAAWTKVNRVPHKQLVAALSGRSGGAVVSATARSPSTWRR